MAEYKDETVVIENARIIFRNFAGKEGKYNREGDRNFAVLLDTEDAKDMESRDWNIKWLEPREEGDEPQAYLSVSVSYKQRPPRIVMITSRGRTPLSEDEVELLDWADIKTIDMILNPYSWAVSGKTGVKAYLRSMFVTIAEDALELKYADLEDAAPRGGRTEE